MGPTQNQVHPPDLRFDFIPDLRCADCRYPHKGLYYGRAAAVTGFIGYTTYTILSIERNAWWSKHQNVSFHFNDELSYAYNFDKIGHFYGTYAWALGVSNLYTWAGMKPSTSWYVGAAFGWLLQFQVEIYDGYIPRYGFDRFDIAANTLGAGWFLAQQHVPTLKNWQVKLGYYPEKIRLEDGSYFELATDQILADDYSNQSYWLAVKLRNYLPENKKSYWPGFLMLSAGVALDEWIPRYYKDSGHLAYYLSIDIDWSQIIPQKYFAGRMLADGMNLFRLPLPALRIHPNVEMVPLYLGN